MVDPAWVSLFHQLLQAGADVVALVEQRQKSVAMRTMLLKFEGRCSNTNCYHRELR